MYFGVTGEATKKGLNNTMLASFPKVPNTQCWVRYSSEVFQIQILIQYHKCILDTDTKYYIENVSRYRYNYKSI